MVELLNPNGILIDVHESAIARKLAAGWSHVEKETEVISEKATKPKIAPKKKSSDKSASKQESKSNEKSE